MPGPDISWEDLSTSLEKRLFFSSERDRLGAYDEIQAYLSQDLEPSDKSIILLQGFLLKHYNHLTSSTSIKRSSEILIQTFKLNTQSLKNFVKALEKVTPKCKSVALDDLFLLASWIQSIFQNFASDKDFNEIITDLTSIQLQIFDSLSYQKSDETDDTHKERIRKSIINLTRRSLNLLPSDLTSSYIKSITSSKFSPDAITTLIGIVSLNDLSNADQASIIDYYVKSILGSKTTLSNYTTFNIFFEKYVDFKTLDSIIIPALEKAVIRSSEVALVHEAALFGALKGLDIPQGLVKSKLLSQIIASLKSSKENVRQLAYSSLAAALHSNVSNEGAITTIADELLKAVKATSAADQKILLYKSLGLIPFLKSEPRKIHLALIPFISKDQNEASLSVSLETFFSHLLNSLTQSDTDFKAEITTISKGLEDSKIQLKKSWFTSLGSTLLKISDKKLLVSFLVEIFPFLIKGLKEIVSNPTNNIKGISIPYVTLSIADIIKDSLDTSEVFDLALNESTKPSILLNYRVFTKLPTTEDKLWYLHALSAASKIKKESNIALGKAWLYHILSSASNSEVRLLNTRLLTKAYSENQIVIGDSLISAIQDSLTPKEEYEFTLDLQKLAYAINAVSQSSELIDLEILKRHLGELSIASHYTGLPKSFSWISSCLRSQIDPGLVVKEYGKLIFERASSVLLENEPTSDIFKAATATISTLAFISPTYIAPLLKNLIEKDLNSEKVAKITNQDVEIWRGTPGELAVNVLDTKKKTVEDKNSKDYETKKWEESVRKEISKKTQLAKKLSKEDQEKVNIQLQKEAEIRSSVSLIASSIKRSIGIISTLSNNVIDNGKSFWVASAANHLLDLLAVPITNSLVGKSATDNFLDLSKVLSSKLEKVGFSLGVATLRIENLGIIDEKFKQEDILDLISRVLFRIKFLADQQPFDSVTLVYILPLLSKVLEQGKLVAIQNSKKPVSKAEFVEEDKEEEQLLLAIEIISRHAEEFKNPAIPRSQIIHVLLSLLSLPSKAKLAKDCLLTLCQYISINFGENDLKDLFTGLLIPEPFVRNAILEALDQEFDLSELNYADEIWIACHDNDSSNAELALTIWDENEFKISTDSIRSLYGFLQNTDSGIRLAVAKALADAVQAVPSEFPVIFEELLQLYTEKARPPEPILDEYGLVVKASYDQKDLWEARSGIAIALKYLSSLFVEENLVTRFFNFIINEKALGDREAIVAEEFKEAAIAIIDSHGAENVENLIPVFESALAAKKSAEKQNEIIRENVVVLYGSLAKHLSKEDARLTTIVQRLLKTLEIPSEKVQVAIADVISPLVPLFKDRTGSYIDTLFKKLFCAINSQVRRGYAYGIAGLTKGYGISAVSEFDIIRTLSDAADDKKDQKRRESTAVVIECLSKQVGKFFEPYVIEILPVLLKSLGDAVPEVRDAAAEAAKVIMKNTTSFGVKKLIPLAIGNLDEISWRSKKGSVELLGSMAYLDPTQLSESLSTIVPEIVGVLNDSHKEVRKAADQSLKRFGEVIRNPEIQTLVPVLINAIGDPSKYTEDALDALIKTQFVHYIDGPSLALIIHVIHRGMRDRSANTKRKACQIVGNMAILVDTRDLLQYLHQLIAELEIAMVDPVPNTRATAARALGALVEKLGEEQFSGLIPRLLDTLGDETKAGDRLGSAQALAEVISGIGIRKLDEILPTILKGATNSRPSTREGFLPMLLFLPVCFGSQFAPYISQVIPAILNGLADTDEAIRGSALRAGRLIVKNYANKAIDLLLPELESGLLDVNHRIRLSSVELIGDLLFQVTGISGKTELVEGEEGDHSGAVNSQLVDILGAERRDRVLSLLFICRSDTAIVVRNAAIDIWKSLVANTPRTIKEILPTLTNIIIRRLANADEGQRTIAAQTLGDIVRRVGANALSQLLPTLEESLQSSDTDAKQGICIATSELLESITENAINEYQEVFVRIVRSALVDSAASVREAAGHAFDVFQNIVGKYAVDEIIPYLLNLLRSPDSENALSALQEVMTTKSEVIFPILIPTLLESPMDSFRARALGSMAEVAGKALYKRLSTVINTLVNELIRADLNPDIEQDLKDSFDKIVLSVEDDEGLHPLLQQFLSLIKGDDSKKRAVIYERLGPFFTHTRLDYTIYTQDIVTQCILSLGDEDEGVAKNAISALTSLIKQQSKDSLEKLIKPSKQALQITGTSGKDLYGFTLPKGPNSVLPIFLHGLMYGSSDLREASALAIADIVSKTPATSLKPLVTVITGPLIRVIGERFSSEIKAAILFALDILFEKIPQFLRPFIPQLQRTFVKSLSDAHNETLRLRAAKALGTLIEYQTRVDPLVSELILGAKNAETLGVKTAMLKALLEVITKAGEKLSETSKTSILNLVEQETLEADEKLAVAYARLAGSLSRILTADEAIVILKSKILDNKLVEDDSSKFVILTLNAFLKDAPHHIFNNGLLSSVIATLIEASNSKSAYISDNATVAIGKLLLLQDEKVAPDGKAVSEEPFDIPFPLVTDLTKQLAVSTLSPPSSSLDTRRLSLVVVRTVSRIKPNIFKPHYDIIAPSVFSSVRDVIIPIKLAAEKAYLALFNLVQDANLETFNKWFEDVSQKGTTIDTVTGTKIQLRSIGDYTKRVGARLAGVERERIEAGGDDETLFSDRIEDETEIWAVGGVDLKKF